MAKHITYTNHIEWCVAATVAAAAANDDDDYYYAVFDIYRQLFISDSNVHAFVGLGSHQTYKCKKNCEK